MKTKDEGRKNATRKLVARRSQVKRFKEDFPAL